MPDQGSIWARDLTEAERAAMQEQADKGLEQLKIQREGEQKQLDSLRAQSQSLQGRVSCINWAIAAAPHLHQASGQDVAELARSFYTFLTE